MEIRVTSNNISSSVIHTWVSIRLCRTNWSVTCLSENYRQIEKYTRIYCSHRWEKEGWILMGCCNVNNQTPYQRLITFPEINHLCIYSEANIYYLIFYFQAGHWTRSLRFLKRQKIFRILYRTAWIWECPLRRAVKSSQVTSIYSVMCSSFPIKCIISCFKNDFMSHFTWKKIDNAWLIYPRDPQCS